MKIKKIQFTKDNLHKFFIGFLIISIFFIWLWVLCFNTINAPFMRDEGEYAYSAQLLHDGGVPYKESFMQKPPMIIYTYYLAQIISQDVWVPRLLVLLSLFFTGLIIANILRREYNLKTALVFLAFFSPMISFLPLKGFLAQPEAFLLLPFTISLWCYFKWCNTQKNIWQIFMVVFSATAILFKPSIFVALLFLFLYMLFYKKTNNHISWKKIFYKGSLFFIGGIISSFVIFLPIILKGGFLHMWESAFFYNRFYVAVASFDFGVLFYLLQFFWPALLLCVWFFIRHLKNRFLFLGLFLSSIIGILGGWHYHYYLIVIPILTVICAIALVDLVENLKSLKNEGQKIFVVIFVVLSFSLLLIYPFKEHFFLNSQQIMNWVFPAMPLKEAVLISNELKKITTDNDKVFIFGNEPEILYYAHRKSVTRFIITYPIQIETLLAEKYGKEVIKELKNNPPKVIITGNLFFNKKLLNYTGINDSYEEVVMRMLMNNYDFVGQTYTEDSGDCKFDNSFNKDKLGDNNLMLFIRKN